MNKVINDFTEFKGLQFSTNKSSLKLFSTVLSKNKECSYYKNKKSVYKMKCEDENYYFTKDLNNCNNLSKSKSKSKKKYKKISEY